MNSMIHTWGERSLFHGTCGYLRVPEGFQFEKESLHQLGVSSNLVRGLWERASKRNYF